MTRHHLLGIYCCNNYSCSSASTPISAGYFSLPECPRFPVLGMHAHLHSTFTAQNAAQPSCAIDAFGLLSSPKLAKDANGTFVVPAQVKRIIGKLSAGRQSHQCSGPGSLMNHLQGLPNAISRVYKICTPAVAVMGAGAQRLSVSQDSIPPAAVCAKVHRGRRGSRNYAPSEDVAVSPKSTAKPAEASECCVDVRGCCCAAGASSGTWASWSAELWGSASASSNSWLECCAPRASG